MRRQVIDAASSKLAILGGSPLLANRSFSWPEADAAVLRALEEAYVSGDWGRYHGRACDRLRVQLVELVNSEFVTLCCSGTATVELALRGVHVRPGDEVLLAGYDFGGNFHAVTSLGARPVLIDVHPKNWNLDPDRIREACSPAMRAIIVSHLHGGVVPMQPVRKIADELGLAVVEDACQCPGATIEGRPAGTWGDVGVFSFGGSKLLTAGRGGALFTSKAGMHQRVRLVMERGNQAFPLSELQAAVLLPQLEKLAQRNAQRARAVARFKQRLAELNVPGISLLENEPLPQTQPGYYKLGMQYDPQALDGVPRDSFLAAAQAEGVPMAAGFRDFSGKSDKRCRKVGNLSHAQAAGGRMLVLHHPILLEDDATLDLAVSALSKVTDALLKGALRGMHVPPLTETEEEV